MSESPQNSPVKPVIAAGAAKRANASVIGMLLAMLSTVAIVMVVVLLNPQQKADSYRQVVDVAAISGHAADVAGFTPAAPVLPVGWSANYARWNGSGADGVAFWDVGFVTSANTFIAMRETITANPTWISNQAQNAPVTGTRNIAGLTWELRDKPKEDRSLILISGKTTIILTGTADFKEFDVLAAAASKKLGQDPTTSTTKGTP
ncbi:DUF4245 domain-containing protein [Arthrobacter cryoconiti]|uniref:DUF4245 domain-containing protein n=1 Tax=Arthrobacter cryoconiti TaxID=748907 RepID=A0ABV8R6P0_9MICC|nr:DUF4245 domain-containing protein [Arthrobacter cryoconiti]MCC9066969.1 DUF4245 domain-containing protein [Arthrobacter cryoconiti]